MSDIDVEPVEDVDDASSAPDTRDDATSEGTTEVDATIDMTAGDRPASVDAPEYVLYGGKGGVGKTTCAAATALASATAGTATLVVSTDPAHSLSDTLDTDVPAQPSRIREDIPLYAAEIDPDEAMQEGMFGTGMATGESTSDGPFGDAPGGGESGVASQLDGLGALSGDESPMEALFGGPMPGADEAAATRELLEHLDDPRFDRVVVDTAPTGHTLRLLQLPELLDSMVGRMVQLRQQFSGMMDGLKGAFGMATGDGQTPDLDELKDRIERLRAVLRDPDRTDFRVVMVPEEMSVVESERLIARLEEFEIPVRTLVVNRVMEDPETVAGSLDDEWVVTPNLDDCEFCSRRWEVQQQALRRASDLYRGREVKRVPLLAQEVRGDTALGVVAACLD